MKTFSFDAWLSVGVEASGELLPGVFLLAEAGLSGSKH